MNAIIGAVDQLVFLLPMGNINAPDGARRASLLYLSTPYGKHKPGAG